MFSRTVRTLCLAWAIGMLSLPAIAADEVDFAVDAAAAAGSIAGVSIGDTEKVLIKSIVRCSVNNTAIVRCARLEVVALLPADARPIASCMIEGLPLQDCAQQEALRRFPPGSQAIARCIAGGGSVEKCGSEEVIRHLPPQSRDIATCISQNKDLGRCARLPADARQLQALAVIDKLKADGRSSIGDESSGAIRNIIGLTQSIRDDNWAGVLRYGGPEVYKAAVKIVLSFLLPGLGPVISNVTEAVVESRIELVEGLVKAAKAGDTPKITALSLEFYLVMDAIPACSIVPPGDFKEATCGNIGKAVRIVADAGGDVTGFAVNRVEDALDLVGIDTGRPYVSACGTNGSYYVTRYMKCLHRGAYLSQGGENIEGMIGSLNNRCRNHYVPCHKQSSLSGICQPLNTRFRTDVGHVSRGLTTAATTFARALPTYVQARGNRTCEPDFDSNELRQFVDRCESSLRTQIPLAGDPTMLEPECNIPSRQFSAPSAHRRACEKAVQRIRLQEIKARVCNETKLALKRSIASAKVAEAQNTPLVIPQRPSRSRAEAENRPVPVPARRNSSVTEDSSSLILPARPRPSIAASQPRPFAPAQPP